MLSVLLLTLDRAEIIILYTVASFGRQLCVILSNEFSLSEILVHQECNFCYRVY